MALARYFFTDFTGLSQGTMSFRGAVKCCVCKRFCSDLKPACPGCGMKCHDKCRQTICCHPCNSCWAKVLQKRSCVCGKSLRSLGVFVERSAVNPPLTPSTVGNMMNTPLPAKRNANGCSRSVSTTNRNSAVSSMSSSINENNDTVRRGLSFDNENEEPSPGHYLWQRDANANEVSSHAQRDIRTTMPLHPHESSRDYCRTKKNKSAQR